MIALLLLACLSFQDIQANYYSSESFRIASATPSELCMEEDSLNIALNRIARANYKHQNYSKGLKMARMVEPRGHRKLKYNTLSIRALLNQNIGNFHVADSLYHLIFDADISYADILFEVHLNYADLLRLNLEYQRRERHLLQALAYGQGWERNKAIRVLARHYMNVFRDVKSAKRILAEHSPAKTPEDRAGYLMVRAEVAEFEANYQRAKRLYIRSAEVARQAGFVGFVYDASDGQVRVSILSEERDGNRMQSYIINGILLFIFAGFALYNFYYG